MNRTIEVLRIEMDGRWYAEELGSAACSISDLYDLRFVLELMSEDERDWEHFFEEVMHFPPFRRQWKRKLMRQQFMLGPFLPLSSGRFDATQLCKYLEPDERLEVRRLRLRLARSF